MAVQVVTGQVTAQFTFTEVATLGFNTAANFATSNPLSASNYNFLNTTGGALGCDTVHAKQYTLASTTTTLDLFGGTLLSPSGAACVFARVRLFVVAPVDTTAGHLVKVYSAASNAPLWFPPVANFMWATPNGGALILFDPSAITTQGYLVDTSHKSITLDSVSNTVVFNVLILGNSSAS